jgi:hypothetical protein
VRRTFLKRKILFFWCDALHQHTALLSTAGSIRIFRICIFTLYQTYMNKKNRYQFKFWRRLLGTSIVLFLASLTQGYLETAALFIATAIFSGMLSVAAIYMGTKGSGIKKFFWSIGFIILMGAFASVLFTGSCYIKAFDVCFPRMYQSTIAVYFALPTFGLLLYIFALFLGSFSKKRYHA